MAGRKRGRDGIKGNGENKVKRSESRDGGEEDKGGRKGGNVYEFHQLPHTA